MRICFTTDLHGRLTQYDQLSSLLRAERPDLLILGGDMHGEADQADPLGTQVAFVERTLAALLETWKSDVPGLEVACILGNHDLACTEAAVRTHQEAGRLVLLDHHQPWHKDGLNLLGLSFAPPSPYWIKDFERLDRPDDSLPELDGAVWDVAAGCVRPVQSREYFRNLPTIAEVLDHAPVVADPWIFVCHAPPHDSKLDRLADTDYPIGSRAVREFIKQRGPLCALHGHVHESPDVTGAYRDRVGRTLCINPGQSHDRLHAVLFESERLAETLRHTVYG